MTTLRSYFNAQAIAKQEFFNTYPCRSIELFSDDNCPCIPRELTLATDSDILEWIDQEGNYMPPRGAKCLLRLLYQELPKGDENSRIINPRFSREVFDHISKSFHLSPEYLELHQARHVPLVINLPSTENKYTTMVLQSATNTLSSSINLSHDSQTGTTQGFFIFNGSRYKQEVIKVLRTVKLDAAHPLLLPTIFLRFWQPVCNQDNAAQSKWMRSAKAITKDVFDPAQASLLQSRITEARKLIFDTHMSAHSPMADFMLNFSANLAQAFNSVPMMVSTMTMRNIMRTHLDFRAMVMAWKCIIDAELEQKVKKTEEIKMEIGVLYNMIQRIPLDYSGVVGPTPKFRAPH